MVHRTENPLHVALFLEVFQLKYYALQLQDSLNLTHQEKLGKFGLRTYVLLEWDMSHSVLFTFLCSKYRLTCTDKMM